MSGGVLERVARAICCEGDVCGKELCPQKCGAVKHWSIEARAAIAEVLKHVEAHLAAVQYDPAPYTSMKHRLARIRKDAGL